jgi:hypothetical protein
MLSHSTVVVDADRVFGSEATTLEIYEAQTKDIIGSAVQGFNGCLSKLRFSVQFVPKKACIGVYLDWAPEERQHPSWLLI